MIIGCVASYPPRLKSLESTISTMLKNVDKLFVYLNDVDSTPGWLQHSKTEVIHSKKALGNLGGSGKFYMADKIGGVYFSFDDDILYPDDYSKNLISVLNEFNGRCVVGVHCKIYKQNPKTYFDILFGAGYEQALPETRRVHMLGAGTLCFDTTILNVDVCKFPYYNMDDAVVSGLACVQGLPRIAIARTAGWLKSSPYMLGTPQVFSNVVADATKINKLTESIPWEDLS